MPKTDYEFQLERERALRTEKHLKRAVNVATHYKTSYEDLKKENEKLKKDLASSEKNMKSVQNVLNSDSMTNSNIMGFGATIASLDYETRKSVRLILRKALHPDKHQVSSNIKDALSSIFVIVEGYFQ